MAKSHLTAMATSASINSVFYPKLTKHPLFNVHLISEVNTKGKVSIELNIHKSLRCLSIPGTGASCSNV